MLGHICNKESPQNKQTERYIRLATAATGAATKYVGGPKWIQRVRTAWLSPSLPTCMYPRQAPPNGSERQYSHLAMSRARAVAEHEASPAVVAQQFALPQGQPGGPQEGLRVCSGQPVPHGPWIVLIRKKTDQSCGFGTDPDPIAPKHDNPPSTPPLCMRTRPWPPSGRVRSRAPHLSKGVQPKPRLCARERRLGFRRLPCGGGACEGGMPA